VQKSVEVFETKALECVGERRVRGNPYQARTLVLSICTIQAMPKRSGRHAWRELSQSWGSVTPVRSARTD